MLIRHNVRKGSNQSVHYAHDTERVDVNGCYVSGRTDKVVTSESHRCPQCGGYGALVAIKDSPRAQYPQGSIVPDTYRLHGAISASIPAEPTFDPATGTVTEPEPDPEPYQVVHSVPVDQPAPVAASSESEEQAAQRMASAMLAAIVPEATKIRETIEQAVKDTTVTVSDALAARFDQTVRDLIVPITVEIKRPDTEPMRIDGTVHSAFTECLAWLQARDGDNRPRNLYLTGPAGCGKTTLAKQLAQALGVPFYTTGTVLAGFDVLGYSDAGGRYHTTPFRQAFDPNGTGGLWLGDEWDAWSPEATLAANGALANGHASFPDTPEGMDAHPDFYCVAAANTWGNGADREYVGRNEMDAATLSRFVTVPMDYDRALETQLAGPYTTWRDLVWRVRDNAREHRMHLMAGTREIVHGVAALNSGMDAETVVTRILRRNLTDQEWGRVTAGA